MRYLWRELNAVPFLPYHTSVEGKITNDVFLVSLLNLLKYTVLVPGNLGENQDIVTVF